MRNAAEREKLAELVRVALRGARAGKDEAVVEELISILEFMDLDTATRRLSPSANPHQMLQ